ncbi:MAG: LPS-assembly protein LptD [Deltaproteobacteria bacterium]|nr:LPS-assembly protein LptD [Deltaproteobacteria bacterium]
MIMMRLIVFFLMMAAAACFPGLAAAQNPDFYDLGGGEPFKMDSDYLSYDKIQDLYRAKGNVNITQQKKSLTADEVMLNNTKGEARATGHVRLTTDDGYIMGEQAILNLIKKTGWVQRGLLFIKSNHFYISGREVEKTGENTYHVVQAGLTTCDGSNPVWIITGSEAWVTMDGYGIVNGAKLQVQSFPIIYLPYFIFPAKTTRQSGLLVPSFTSSSRNGFEIDVPFYWAINDQMDATFHQDYMARRGLMEGLEYRYAAGTRDQGTFRISGLNDLQTGDNFIGDNIPRTNDSRWWLRGKLNQDAPSDIRVKADFDLVSDREFLREFTSGFNSISTNREDFLEHFGRDIDDNVDEYRQSRVVADKKGDSSMAYGKVSYFQKSTAVSDDPTVQELPKAGFIGSRLPVMNDAVYLNWDANAAYFWREQGVKATRTDLHPSASLPLHYKNFLDFEGTLGLRETAYQFQDRDSSFDKSDYYRHLYDLTGNLSTSLSKVYPFNVANFTSVRHQLRPFVTYRFRPDENPDQPMNFDGQDYLDKVNTVTYGLDNMIMAKLLSGGQTSYWEMLRLRVSQAYDFTNGDTPQSDNLMRWRLANISKWWRNYENVFSAWNPRPRNQDDMLAYQTYLYSRSAVTGDHRSFSPVKLEMEFTPTTFMVVNTDTSYSTQDDEFKSFNCSAYFNDKRGDMLGVDYRFTQDRVKELNTRILIKVIQPISLIYENKNSFEANTEVESRYGINYQAQCWGLDLSYSKKEEDTSITFVISLFGLGNSAGFSKGM